MPRRRSRIARTRRSRRGRLRRRSRRLPPIGFPTQKMVRLRYVEEVSLDAAPLSITSAYFSANGMYDPRIASGGHQPLYFDQYMAGYDHYRVLGSKIKVTQVPWGAETAANIPGVWGVLVDDNTTISYTKASEIIESNQGLSNWRMGSNGSQGHNNGKNPTLIRGFSTKKFFNRSNASSDDLRGSTTSNPVEQAYYALWAGPVSGNDPTSMTFMVEIEYIAKLEEPKFVAQS